MKTISLKVPETMERELARQAESRGLSKSDLLREAVAEYLVERDAPAAGSFLAAATDLAGCLDDAPDDLSYNPEHLAGYGK